MKIREMVTVVLGGALLFGCGASKPLPLPSYEHIAEAQSFLQRAERDCERLAGLVELQVALRDYCYDHHNVYPVAKAVELGSAEAKTLCEDGFRETCEVVSEIPTPSYRRVKGKMVRVPAPPLPPAEKLKTYTPSIRANPQPGGTRFMYRSEHGDTYDISFQLEAGCMPPPGGLQFVDPFSGKVEFGARWAELGPGSYVLTPEGVLP